MSEKIGEHYNSILHGDSNDLARFINTNFLSGILNNLGY